MTVIIRVPTLRSLALVFAGVALGVTLVPPVSARVTGADAVVPATTYTRTVSCQGLNFHPDDSKTGYDYDNSSARELLYRSVGYRYYDTGLFDENGSGFFQCDPGLPDKAVVTRVRFTLLDNANGYAEVRYCGLFRSGLALSDTTYDVLASFPTTGMFNASPNPVRLSKSVIAHATVDNTKWAYFLSCQINLGTDVLSTDKAGIYGADVTYTISAANG
jgi:hypothetical protein